MPDWPDTYLILEQVGTNKPEVRDFATNLLQANNKVKYYDCVPKSGHIFVVLYKPYKK